MMGLPLYTVDDGTDYYDCYNSDDVCRVFNKIRERDIYRRLPAEVKVYTWLTWEDITSEFIRGC